MEHSKLKNFEFTYDGKSYWYSRAMATSSFIFFHDLVADKWYLLANKRGSGAPNERGKWNCICGYLDHDEGIKDCAYRELFEETGLKIFKGKNRPDLNLFRISDDPKDSTKQNVTFQFVGVVEFSGYGIDEWENKTSMEHMEPDEVEEIKFIPIEDVGKYKWAFNHLKVIKTHLLPYISTGFKWFNNSSPIFSMDKCKKKES